MEAVIVEAVRTPIGRAHAEKGAFRDTHPATLLAACLTVGFAASNPGERSRPGRAGVDGL